jgi:hypothetical protein
LVRLSPLASPFSSDSHRRSKPVRRHWAKVIGFFRAEMLRYTHGGDLRRQQGTTRGGVLLRQSPALQFFQFSPHGFLTKKLVSRFVQTHFGIVDL